MEEYYESKLLKAKSLFLSNNELLFNFYKVINNVLNEENKITLYFNNFIPIISYKFKIVGYISNNVVHCIISSSTLFCNKQWLVSSSDDDYLLNLNKLPVDIFIKHVLYKFNAEWFFILENNDYTFIIITFSI